MPVDFSGTWSLAKSDGLAPLLDALKVPAEKRPSDESATVVITQSGDSFVIKTTTAAGTREAKFSIGTPFVDQDIKELRGKDIEVTGAWDGDKLVLKGAGGNSVTREIVGGQMVVTFDFGGISAKRYFTKS
ncbi:fatty acid-binding protein, intestinal-like [Anneissia japonica]|uniref:fatty acid-binding protein, intestinal-like n=1 Tax=Anneissia japonica TaxID=1529436 RepID=UPI001425AF9C|nr:fatty acid-binding protein, intestinal-like [Anneissia japonica]